jgi:hypothetical protein
MQFVRFTNNGLDNERSSKRKRVTADRMSATLLKSRIFGPARMFTARRAPAKKPEAQEHLTSDLYFGGVNS